MRRSIIPIVAIMLGTSLLAGCESPSEDAAYEDVAEEALSDDEAEAMAEAADAEAIAEASEDASADQPSADRNTPYSSDWIGEDLTTGSADFSSRAPASTDPVVQCGRPRKMLRQTECAKWEAYFASLDTAAVDVDAPDSMWRGEKETIEVSLLLDDEAAQESESEGAEVIVGSIPVTPIMGARLRGDRFDVVATTTSTISMPGADPEIVFIEVGIASRPTWKWEVTARGDGDEQLVVELFLVPDRDGDAPTEDSFFKDAEARIVVQVKWVDRINDWIDEYIPVVDNLTQFIIALTALAAAIFGLVKVFKKRGKE